jgi:calcium/calmodulin-dependent protein kinase I
MEEEDEIQLMTEVEILSQLDHPNAVKLYEVFDMSDKLFLVMELLSGGELFDRIVEKESYNEREASDTIRPIVDAIRYCHSIGVIHRDLKPENLLYANDEEGAPLKITDFGVARFIQSFETATTACGSPHYIAPEVIIGHGYGCEVDYWSIGIIIYIM